MAFLPTNPFIQIINREIPADIVYENDKVIAFKDIHPKAKTHILICPKVEIVTAREISEENSALFGDLILAAKVIADDLDLKGYKLHMNVGESAGQVVPHVHLHMLSSDFNCQL